ncbi:TIGR01777 family oxidoreductase [uncultured Dokdonia sp.]|uniref:TIGR01777 family oxidoreductase n=1 Tax=uncultured Dokdonia sp. TaxID=575653 RepID=UPI0026252AF1|nr:TIGR01777 family oxidoreductase [uncultured Dokdonia sp.]
MKKLIIAGGTGFLGSVIISYFKDSFDEIVLLSRLPAGRQESTIKDNSKTVIWDAKTIDDWATELDGADVLINMTGRSVDCRYHQKNKDLILNSRVDSTTVLGEAIAVCKNPPKVWLNSSTATIYRHSLDKEMDEEHGEIGNGFSVSIAKAWEKAFFEANTPSTRKVALRTAIVLGKEGGALQPMTTMTKLGLGGKQGSGDQKFSWIHEDDFVQIIDFCIKNSEIDGVINVVSPHPSDNKTLMRLLRKTLNIPFGIPAPKPILEMGAFLIRTETELLLKSRNVIPKRLLEHGYTFSYQNLETALKELTT